MNKGYIALWILGFIVLIVDLGLVISILKKGDERRQLIVWKSSTYAFSIIVGILILDCISKLIIPAFDLPVNNFNNGSSSFSLLTITSITYFITLKYNQKKFGN